MVLELRGDVTCGIGPFCGNFIVLSLETTASILIFVCPCVSGTCAIMPTSRTSIFELSCGGANSEKEKKQTKEEAYDREREREKKRKRGAKTVQYHSQLLLL